MRKDRNNLGHRYDWHVRWMDQFIESDRTYKDDPWIGSVSFFQGLLFVGLLLGDLVMLGSEIAIGIFVDVIEGAFGEEV